MGTDCAKHGDASTSKTASVDASKTNTWIVSMMNDNSCSRASRAVFACRCSVMPMLITHQPKTAPHFIIDRRNFHDFTPAYMQDPPVAVDCTPCRPVNGACLQIALVIYIRRAPAS